VGDIGTLLRKLVREPERHHLTESITVEPRHYLLQCTCDKRFPGVSRYPTRERVYNAIDELADLVIDHAYVSWNTRYIAQICPEVNVNHRTHDHFDPRDYVRSVGRGKFQVKASRDKGLIDPWDDVETVRFVDFQS